MMIPVVTVTLNTERIHRFPAVRRSMRSFSSRRAMLAAVHMPALNWTWPFWRRERKRAWEGGSVWCHQNWKEGRSMMLGVMMREKGRT